MKAWQLLEQNGWCKGSLAVNRVGRRVGALNPDAVRFCLLGAILRCYQGKNRAGLLNKLEGAIGPYLGHWNDHQRSAKPVVALLKRLGI